jgi:hypothetical protein
MDSKVHSAESRRRLQQYQREMVAQATLAATRAMGNSAVKTTFPGDDAPVLAAGRTRMGAPRLNPRGSPGPVTPMELATSNAREGYLTLGGALTSPDSTFQSEEITRALRVEEERLRREGQGSPVVSPGPATC